MDVRQNDVESVSAEPLVRSPRAVKAKKPFPSFQLAILFLLKLTEPINSTVIYPFVNQQVRDTGITRGDESATGYYAGLIASRVLSLFIPITDPADVPIAFGWLPAMWSTGITLGPLIGGTMAQPAVRWPDTLGHIQFFRDYPYFLPCVTAGGIAFISFLYAYYFLNESLPSAIQRQKRVEAGKAQRCLVQDQPYAPLLDPREPVTAYGARQEPTVDSNDSATGARILDAPPPLLSLLSRDLIIGLVNHGFYCFLDQSHTVLLPLMLSTSIQHGGLGFDSFTIGMIMGIWGISNAIFQLVSFSRIVKWLGPRTTYRFSFMFFITSFGAYPLMSVLARRTGHANTHVWFVLVIQLTLHCFACMSYPCAQLFILDAAPGNSALGAVNGLSQMMSSVVRTPAPTIASSLFSLSQGMQLLGGYLVYAVIIWIVLTGWSMSLFLPPTLRGQLKET
ncbi:hypothetical protein C0995_008009 [Termitomyces sp. Mi166|nr:hypothetical protein C0995_008009 [Termitomyces sp. Mi166\